MSDALTLDSIPHRPPFLFVDEIVSVEPGRINTRKLADPGAEFFKGHYPGQPVMPAVLLCECCFQAGALLIAHRIGAYGADEGVPVVTRIGEGRFKRMVRPGDLLEIEVTLDDELEGAYYLTGRVTVGGKLAARVSFACMQASPRREG